MSIYIINTLSIIVYGVLFYLLTNNEKEYKVGYYKIVENNHFTMKKSEYVFNRNNIKLIFCSLISFQLFIILALRSISVGGDVQSYQNLFYEFHNVGFIGILKHGFEEGYALINGIVIIFSKNFHVVMTIVSAITSGSLLISIYKNSKYPIISYFLYVTMSFYYFAFSGIRQGVAIAISIVGLKYLKEKKIWKYLIVILIATSFHYSALIMIPAYFLITNKLSVKWQTIITGITVLFYVFIDKIFLLLANFIPRYNDVYASQSGIAEFMGGQSWKSMIICIFVFLLMSIFKNEMIKKDDRNIIFYNISFASVLLSLFQTKVSVLDRLPIYLNIYMIFSIPILIDCFNKDFVGNIVHMLPNKIENKLGVIASRVSDKMLKIIMTISIIMLGLLYSIYYFSNDYYRILPYQILF